MDYGTVNMFLKLLYRQAKVLTVENDGREIIDTQNFPAKCLAWKSPNQWRAEVAVAKQALGLSEHDLLPQKTSRLGKWAADQGINIPTHKGKWHPR